MNPDALVFRGQEGTGQAQVFNNTAYQMARQSQQDVLAADLRKAALIDQKMQAGLQNIDVKLDGFDVDVNGQLMDMQEDVRQTFINSWKNQIDPNDPRNREVWADMNRKTNKLKAAVQASKHQEAIYFENLRKLNSDKGKSFNTEKSMKQLEKYRNASVEERERMGLDILVQRDISAVDVFRDTMKDYGWSPTKGLPTVRDADGNFRQTTWKEMPVEQMKESIAMRYMEDTREGETLREKYETVNDALDAFESTIPDPAYNEKFSKKSATFDFSIGINPKEIKSVQKRMDIVNAIVDESDETRMADLKSAKINGLPVQSMEIITNDKNQRVIRLEKGKRVGGKVKPSGEYEEIVLDDSKTAKRRIWHLLNTVEGNSNIDIGKKDALEEYLQSEEAGGEAEFNFDE